MLGYRFLGLVTSAMGDHDAAFNAWEKYVNVRDGLVTFYFVFMMDVIEHGLYLINSGCCDMAFNSKC